MRIYLLCDKPEMIKYWGYEFNSNRTMLDYKNTIIISNNSFYEFMKTFHDIEGIVSPANSFGYMDGGYDKAIIDYLGEQAQTNVLTMLNSITDGYQPVGTCIGIPFGKYTILHTPTMRYPEEIIDPRVVFDCMLSVLKYCDKNNIKSVVIPAFGEGTGKVSKSEVAKYMALAYSFHIQDKPKNIDWSFVRDLKQKLSRF